MPGHWDLLLGANLDVVLRAEIQHLGLRLRAQDC